MKFNLQLRNFLYNLHVSLFGIGNLPYAPGTFGSIAALIVLIIPEDYQSWTLVFLVLSNTILSLITIKQIEKIYGDDPPFVVIDEAIGMWLILLSPYIPHNFIWVTVGLVLFRYFDIKKPYPINLINEKKGAIYVILDDVLAAVLSIIIMYILYFGYQILPFYSLFLIKS